MARAEFDTAILGFGPAGTGVLVAAANEGTLDQLLDRGLVAVEASSTPGPGYLAEPIIQSNSPWGDFLEGLQPDGPFGDVLGRESVTGVVGMNETPVPSLSEYVAPLLVDVGQSASNLINKSGGQVHTDTSVFDIQQIPTGDSRNPLYVARTNLETITARNIVLATGAQEAVLPQLSEFSDRVTFSGDVIAGRLDPVKKAVDNGETIGILGGSHSAFSAAGVIREEFGDQLKPEQVVLVHRKPISVYQEWYEGTERIQLHRFDGIRHAQAQLHSDIVTGAEKRIKLQQVSSPNEAAVVLGDAGAIVQATGYRTRRVPIYRDGVEIGPMTARDGQTGVDVFSRVKGHDGAALPGVWGIGLGYGLRSQEGGVRLDGVNVYQGKQGKHVARGLTRSR